MLKTLLLFSIFSISAFSQSKIRCNEFFFEEFYTGEMRARAAQKLSTNQYQVEAINYLKENKIYFRKTYNAALAIETAEQVNRIKNLNIKDYSFYYKFEVIAYSEKNKRDFGDHPLLNPDNWKSINEDARSKVSLIVRRYKNDENILYQAMRVMNTKYAYSHHAGEIYYDVLMTRRRDTLKVRVPSININKYKMSWGSNSDNLTFGLSKAIAPIIIGSIGKAIKNDKIKKIAFYGEEIVNKELVKSLNSIGFKITKENRYDNITYMKLEIEL